MRDPSNYQNLERLGDWYAGQNQPRQAVEAYVACNELAPFSISRYEKLAFQWMKLGHPYEAMEVQQQILSRVPNSTQTQLDLVGLATMVGETDLALQHLKWLVTHNVFNEEILVVLAQPFQVEPDTELCQRSLTLAPEDLRVHYGLARIEAQSQQWSAVKNRLQPVLKRYPEFTSAQVLYGRALVELNDQDLIQNWSESLPTDVSTRCEYWLAVGKWFMQQKDIDQATKALIQGTRLGGAGYNETLALLGNCLTQQGRNDEAVRVGQELKGLAKVQDALKTLLERRSQSQSAALGLAQAMESLGRFWEAEAWARLALQLPQDHLPDANAVYQRIRARLSPSTPWQVATVADSLKGQGLSNVNWGNKRRAQEMSFERRSEVAFRFSDVAQSRGLDHMTNPIGSAKTEGHWIYQSTGGGAAVLDFDLDGWPDVALASLDGSPMANDSSANALFRNQDGNFHRVTVPADWIDRGFCQGISVGDYNNDGFDDLFVSNIGQNRLHRNNGDGTFTDVTASVGLTGERWTSSSAIADIDGDGFADIFEVNYCAGRRPFEQACRHRKSGKLTSCTPVDFDAECDTVFRGSASGTFTEVTGTWLEPTDCGRGLGLVVAQLDGKAGLDIYVANDMTANHYWSRNSLDTAHQESLSIERDSNAVARWVDSAASRGLAVSAQSMSQASMGIACADADLDGDLDLFLTHFSGEHNTFYEQVAPGTWMDRSAPVGLFEPSIPLLAFGTQFADFDNDRVPELVVTNGHVSNLERDDVKYRMPPQLFEQRTRGAWSEVNASSVGDYFASDHLGRALALLDFDRDGRTDFLVTHLDEPVALLANQTETANRAIGLVLKSTTGHRDAIGTEVFATLNSQTVYAQRITGDGYMCSNESRVVVACGDQESAEIEVRWPSGQRQTLGSLPSGEDYLVVEGDPPFRLNRNATR